MHDSSGIIAADDYDIENLKCPLCNFKLVYIKCDDGECKLVCPRNYKNKSLQIFKN